MADSRRQRIAIVAVCTCAAIVVLWRAAISISQIGDTVEVSDIPARMAARGETVPPVVKCREVPITVVPVRRLPHLVSEDDLVSVLCSALPLWTPPTVPSAFHEMKLWGAEAEFRKDIHGIAWSGNKLLRALLNDKECLQQTANVGGSYLLDSPYGIRIVLAGTVDAVEFRAEAHYGQLLAILGEMGVSSLMPVVTASGRNGTVSDIYQDALLRFSLSQDEIEFFACALAFWHPPSSSWTDQFGVRCTFDQLVTRLLEHPLGKGSCGGCHIPYAIATILRVDEQQQLLSGKCRQRAEKWLYSLSQILEERQLAAGGWDKAWSAEDSNPLIWNDDLLDRITVTGHHLEWIAIAPEVAQPSESTIKRAVQCVRRDVEALPPLPKRTFKSLLPVSHAARALSLFRGDDPYTVWLQYWHDRRITQSANGFSIQPQRP